MKSIVLALVFFAGVGLFAHTLNQHNHKNTEKQAVDSVSLQRQFSDFGTSHKMSTSAFPVQVSMSGRVVKVQSDHNQILPIYSQNGVFYMAMRLNKGTNWLNGLPRGRYYINNHPFVIN